MVEYTYDTWGKKVTTTGTLAGTLGLFQPFRYRGYVYDWETGFYYLQSRYYDPTTGRFISADVLLSTVQGVLGHNCYAYCLDNPVMMVDDGGNAANWAVSVMMADGGGGCSLIIDLGSGWLARIDKPSDALMHIHVWNKSKNIKYAQNEDGSPHDEGHNSQGKLPKWLQKVLKEKTGWDYNGKRDKFFKKTQYKILHYTESGSHKKAVEYTFADGTVLLRKKTSLFDTTNSFEKIYYEGSNVSISGDICLDNPPLIIMPMFDVPTLVPSLPDFGFSFLPAFGF